jgi:hypothetical protein
MAFRQNTNQGHKSFLKSSQQELMELGVPLRTLDYDAWSYLLEHGYCAYTDWTFDGLNQQQAVRLLELVEAYAGNYSPMFEGLLKWKISKG